MMRTEEEILAELEPLRARVDALNKEYAAVRQKNLGVKFSGLFKDGITLETVMLVDVLELERHEAACDKVHGWITRNPIPGVFQTGYMHGSNQFAWEIKLSQHLPLQDQLGAEIIIPHLKPILGGWKRLGIFEASLCQNGVYALYIKESENRYVVTRNWSPSKERGEPDSYQVNKEAGSLREALQYIYDTLPYEPLSGDDDDEDYDWSRRW